MFLRITGAVAIVAAVTATAMLAVAPSANAEKERIAFPENYRAEMVNYLSLDRTQNDDQVIRLFAPQSALDAAKSGGKIPNGTTLVAEIYKAKKDDKGEVIESDLGRRIRGKFAAVAVMQRGEGWSAKYPEELRTGDWDFAIFNPAGERLVKKDLNSCRSCHAPLKETQYLFSIEHMK